jgi:hypothetical protein
MSTGNMHIHISILLQFVIFLKKDFYNHAGPKKLHPSILLCILLQLPLFAAFLLGLPPFLRALLDLHQDFWTGAAPPWHLQRQRERNCIDQHPWKIDEM